MRDGSSEGSVLKVETVALNMAEREWDYARSHADQIDEHWLRSSAANPGYFNGVIHLIDRLEVRGQQIRAELIKTDFKSFLFWRDAGFPTEAGVLDGFGSALIRSREGHILLGRQRAGNINAGLSYLPGGFIDARDVGPNGAINIKASIAREVFEETGLGETDVETMPGFIVTQTGRQVSFAAAFQSPLASHQLLSKIGSHLGKDPDSELEAMLVVRGAYDLQGLAMPPYARVLLSQLFKAL